MKTTKKRNWDQGVTEQMRKLIDTWAPLIRVESSNQTIHHVTHFTALIKSVLTKYPL